MSSTGIMHARVHVRMHRRAYMHPIIHTPTAFVYTRAVRALESDPGMNVKEKFPGGHEHRLLAIFDVPVPVHEHRTSENIFRTSTCVHYQPHARTLSVHRIFAIRTFESISIT